MLEYACLQWVVTAGHCEANTQTTVWLGEHNRDVPGVADYGSRNKVLRIGVGRAITHPRYPLDQTADIALLRLRTSVDFARYPHIRPVCLPPGNKDYRGKKVVTTGWGQRRGGNGQPGSPTLQEAQLVVYNVGSYVDCRGYKAARSSCFGDSGGPLIARGSQNSRELIGVVSWGPTEACITETHFTRVATFLPWIRRNARGGASCPRA